MTDWKPGDVAMVRPRAYSGIPNAEKLMFRVVAGIPLGARSEDGDVWMLHHGGHCVDENAESVRPLVVIDPEDADQVDQLTKVVVEACYRDGNVTVSDNGIHPDTMQAALREFANPKPPKCESKLQLNSFEGIAVALYACNRSEGHDGPHCDDVEQRTWSQS